MESQGSIAEGTTIYAADGEKLGKVVSTTGQTVVVEKGFFFPTNYEIPVSAIQSYDGSDAYLAVGKDDALAQRWTVAGVADTGMTTGTDAAYSTTATTMDAGYDATERIEDNDVLRVPVHEEELSATKRAVELGEVRIDKDVISEERTLDVPVTEERVRVTRRTVDRDGAADADAFTEGTIEVPVRGEQVDLQKRVRVAEEVEIAKEQVGHTERVSGTVRREEVRIDDATTSVSGTSRTSSSSSGGGEGIIDRAKDALTGDDRR